MGMPPAVVGLLLMISPEFVRPLFFDPIGHFLLVAGITLQTIGYFAIKKIIKIQV
jgi:Flp pilus assembly protein TadB